MENKVFIVLNILAGFLTIYYGLNMSRMDYYFYPGLILIFLGLIFMISMILAVLKKKNIAGYISLINSIFLIIVLLYNYLGYDYNYLGYDYRDVWNNAWFYFVPFVGIISFVTSRKVFNKVKLKPYILILITFSLLIPWAILAIANGILPLTEFRATVLFSYPAIWIVVGLLFLYLVWFSYTFSSRRNFVVCSITSLILVFFWILCLFKNGAQFLLGVGSELVYVPIIILAIVLMILATISYLKEK